MSARPQSLRTPSPQHRQRGAALLLAMLILGLVTTITAGMVWQQQRAITVEAAERARAQSSWILIGALDWARLILREDGRPSNAQLFDSLDEPWATPLAEARLSSFLAADKDNNADTGPEAFISGTIVDANSRLNLRGLVTPDGKPDALRIAAFRRLAETAGAPTDTVDRIVTGLVASGPPVPGGPNTAAPIRPGTVSDLAWFGIDPATLERLRPYVELLPEITAVNVNTASREVLVAAIDDLESGTAERLVQARQREPFKTLEALKPQLSTSARASIDKGGRVAVMSNWFEVTGRLRLEDRVVEERSLLERKGQQVTVRRSERRSVEAVATPGGG